MPAPFAALEQQANASVLAHLANAVALIGAQRVPVVFDRASVDAFDGLADATSPQCLGPSAQLAGLDRESELRIEQGGVATTWRIARAEPDGIGLTRVRLYLVD